MAKRHSYAFDIIPFKNYQEATRVQMPDILHNSQTETAFMPKPPLPNIPRVVDEQEYEAKKGQLDERDLQLLDMKAEREDSQAAHGDIAEKELFQELQNFDKNKKLVVQTHSI